MGAHRRFSSVSVALALAGVLVAGCSSKHKGAGVAGSGGRNVDASWATAIQSCWPDLSKQGYSTEDIRSNLATPTHFRNAFPVYAAQNDDAVDLLLAKPLQTAPDPDITKLTHSNAPVLTRGQAANGTGPRDAAVQSTNGQAPPDAFCAIQSGIPQGFSK
jgi:hypothetical protein